MLAFWFTELDRKAWFVKDAAVDEKIRTRFLPLIEELASRPADEALTSPDRALATVIALDQFPRNLFRGTARAFASDALALAIAKARRRSRPRQQVPADRKCSSICLSSTANPSPTRTAASPSPPRSGDPQWHTTPCSTAT